MKTLKRIHFIPAIVAFSTLAFVACGDDDSSVKSVMDSDEVDELGECNSENEKDIKYVSSEDLYYKCVEGNGKRLTVKLTIRMMQNPVPAKRLL